MRSMRVPIYTFRLRNDGGDVEDNSGIALNDNRTAYRYAESVARELMRSREIDTRYWHIEVYRDGQGPLFDILFASVDPTLDHLRRELRALVESVSEKKRALKDVVYDSNFTLRESQSLLAQSRGKPYLIAENGEITIRGFDRRRSAR
jgi:cytolysin (calcineurin-like family phosphatase)